MKQETINAGSINFAVKINQNLTIDGNVLIYNSTLEKVDGEVAHVD